MSSKNNFEPNYNPFCKRYSPDVSKCHLCADMDEIDIYKATADVKDGVCTRCGYDFVSHSEKLPKYKKSELIDRLLRIMKIQMPYAVEQHYTEKKVRKFLSSRSKQSLISDIKILEWSLTTTDNIWDALYYKFDKKPEPPSTPAELNWMRENNYIDEETHRNCLRAYEKYSKKNKSNFLRNFESWVVMKKAFIIYWIFLACFGIVAFLFKPVLEWFIPIVIFSVFITYYCFLDNLKKTYYERRCIKMAKPTFYTKNHPLCELIVTKNDSADLPLTINILHKQDKVCYTITLNADETKGLCEFLNSEKSECAEMPYLYPYGSYPLGKITGCKKFNALTGEHYN